MSMPTVNIHQAIQNAQNALQRGDKLSVRRWARLAVTLAPEREEAWLLLAAVAHPRASVGYLKQALKLNPASPRARAGMDWALKRAERAAQTATTARVRVMQRVETAAQTATTIPTRIRPPVETTRQTAITARVRIQKPQNPVSDPKNVRKSSQSFFFILLPIVLLTVLALSIWNASPVLAVFSSPFNPASKPAPAWASAKIPKPTMTPTATATLAPMPTPTSTPIASPTTEPTPTALPTDSGAPARPNQPADPAYTGGKSILVDISEQHLYAYENDTLVYSFVASTGMGNSTAAGTFHVQDKIPNAYGATWNIWMPDWLGIYYAGGLENGIHALPILSNGVTLWDGYLGTPISFGCVVLGAYEAEQLYNWAEIGTPVIIQW